MTSLEELGTERISRPAIAPIPSEAIKEYFIDKRVFFQVNHSDSKLKNAMFLTYLSNLNLPSDITFNEPLGYEEYSEIMLAYLSQRMVSNLHTLDLMCAQLMLWAKGLEYEDIPYNTSISQEYLHRFARENIDRVVKWINFIDSSIVFGYSSIQSLNEKHKPEESYPVIEDKEYVGHNVVNLYDVPHFTALYFAIPNAYYKLAYFKHQFEDYMFGNKRMAQFFESNNNFLQVALCATVQGVIDPLNIEKLEINGSTEYESAETTHQD